MYPKKITIKELSVLYSELQKGSHDSIGNYLYKGLRIQISKYKSTNAERYLRLYKTRRGNGLCIQCGKKITKTNPITGKLYRLCDFHRKITDRKK